MRKVVLGVALATFGAAWAHGQSGWEADLALEIEASEKCKVAYLSHVVERDVDGKKLVMAKAHCEDQRVFDAMRPAEYEPFRFNECLPDATQAC